MLYKLWISTQLSGVKKLADLDLHSFQKRDTEFAKNDSSTKCVDPDEI